MKADVSVVIPTYKRADLLQQCLLALQNQQFDGLYEVIVVSDGKDNATAELLTHITSNKNASFVYSSLNEKSGPAAARNLGWRMASGGLIVFTDDDTQPSPKWLQSYWNMYKKNGIEDVAFSGKLIVPLSKKPTDYERNTSGLETADFVTANCACTKDALQKVNGFDENFAMAWREDSDLLFKLLRAGIQVIKAPDAWVLHPVRKAGWGVSLKEQKKTLFNALLYKKHPQLFRSKIMASPLWNYYGIIVSFFLSLCLFIAGFYTIASVSAVFALTLITVFSIKRLRNTSHSFSHVCEMIVTSLLIPFLSVFWTLYGAIKFRVFFL